nr:hypothetical protein [Tanacetum cinerariifolium]
MSNTNNNLQTQTSNTLHNAIMEAGGKDHPPMLASGNYVQWKSRIKRYIDTKPNHELIHYCLKNPPYKFTWVDNEVPISEGSSITTTKTYMENYKNVSQGIRDDLNVEAEAVQIILTGIDNDIYSTVDACPNEFRKFTSRDGESLESYYSRFYKMMNELVRNQCDVTNHQVNVQFLLQLQPEWQRNLGMLQRNVRNQKGQRMQLITGKRGYCVSNDDHYNVFAIESEHPEQSKSVRNTYPIKQDEHNVIIDSLDMSYDREQIDQNVDDDDLANECELLAPLIEKLKCEIDDSKNRNKFLETSNKVLVDKLKGEIEDFKTKNKSVESSNNHFKEANNKLSETNKLIQSVQTMNMLNHNCKTSFAKHEFYKKAQRANPRLYDIGCYNDNLALMFAPESDDSKMMSKSFEALQKHVINLEIDLQRCQEKIKNEKSFKENQSKEFFKEREQYFEIQDLKAQLQDKGITMSELKKLIEKLKGKSVDTKFEKSLVIRQPNAFKSQRPSILGKPTIFLDSLERKDFLMSKSVTKNNVVNDFSKPVTAQILSSNKKSILKNTKMLAPGMYKLHTE